MRGVGNIVEAYQKQIKMFSREFEFATIILIAFGYLIIGSVIAFLIPVATIRMTGSYFHFLLIYETLVLFFLGWFLRLRGWRLERLGLKFNEKDLLTGAWLATAAYIAYYISWFTMAIMLPDIMQTIVQRKLSIPDIGLFTIISVSIINPVFEEIFVCGYVISALKEDKGLWFAVVTSIAIRLLYHVYQGPIAFICIIPVGLIFGYWFAKTGRLWPTIAAHAIIDVIALQTRA